MVAIRLAILQIFTLLSLATLALAEEKFPALIISQTIGVPFKPVSAFALVESRVGEIKQYKAIAIPKPLSTNLQGNQTYLAASPIPAHSLNDTANNSLRFAFFLASVNGEFAAGEVTELSYDQLKAESISIDELNQAILKYEKELPDLRTDNADLEAQLMELRDKASKIANVDDIIDLKVELENLKGFDEKKIVELDRLRALINLGRTSAEPTEADKIRTNLISQLTESAKITAFADRIANRKRDSALANYRRKVNLVKTAEGVDAETLAQEVLALRKRRRELESRLNLNSTPEGVQNEF